MVDYNSESGRNSFYVSVLDGYPPVDADQFKNIINDFHEIDMEVDLANGIQNLDSEASR